MKTFPGQFALRYPFRSPDEDAGAAEAPAFEGEAPLTSEFEEREGDREPEAEEHVEAEEEAPAEIEAQAEEPAAEGQAEAEGEGDPEPEAQRPRKDWKQARIDKAVAKAKEAEERATRAEERAAALEALYGNREEAEGGAPAPKLYTEAEVDARAAAKARVNDLNSRADKLFDDGAAKFGKEWTARLTEVNEAFGSDLAQRPDIFDAITKLPNAADVYHALGGDLDHLAHVLDLSPVELGMELKGMSDNLAKPKAPAVSRAPAPIKPLERNNVEDMPLDQLANDPSPKAMKAFDERMRKEEEKRWAQRR